MSASYAALSRFDRFFAQGGRSKNKIEWNKYTLFGVLVDNTRGYLTSCVVFFPALRIIYKTPNKAYILFHITETGLETMSRGWYWRFVKLVPTCNRVCKSNELSVLSVCPKLKVLLNSGVKEVLVNAHRKSHTCLQLQHTPRFPIQTGKRLKELTLNFDHK